MDTLGFTSAPISDEHLAMVKSMPMRQFVRISGLDISEDALEELMSATRAR